MIKNAFAYVTRKSLKSVIILLVILSMSTLSLISLSIKDATNRASEETFGPVAACFRFKTEEEAVRRANNTPFGLAAYFYSKDISRVFRVSEAIEAGMIGINDTGVSTAVAPFGGVKESGLGREGSVLGLEEYLEVKTLHLGNL